MNIWQSGCCWILERQECIDGYKRLGLWTSALNGGGECAWGKVILKGIGGGGPGGVVCWVVGGLGHARHYMPSKISSSCLGPTGQSGLFVCVSVCASLCVYVEVNGVHRYLR